MKAEAAETFTSSGGSSGTACPSEQTSPYRFSVERAGTVIDLQVTLSSDDSFFLGDAPFAEDITGGGIVYGTSGYTRTYGFTAGIAALLFPKRDSWIDGWYARAGADVCRAFDFKYMPMAGCI